MNIDLEQLRVAIMFGYTWKGEKEEDAKAIDKL